MLCMYGKGFSSCFYAGSIEDGGANRMQDQRNFHGGYVSSDSDYSSAKPPSYKRMDQNNNGSFEVHIIFVQCEKLFVKNQTEP